MTLTKALELNDRQYWLLSALAYMDLSNKEDKQTYNREVHKLIDNKTPITEIDQNIKDNGQLVLFERDHKGKYRLNEHGQPILMNNSSIGLNGEGITFQSILKEISEDPILSRLVLKDHFNDNQKPDVKGGDWFRRLCL